MWENFKENSGSVEGGVSDSVDYCILQAVLNQCSNLVLDFAVLLRVPCFGVNDLSTHHEKYP